MPKLNKPFEEVQSCWGKGVLDFQYAEEGRFRLILCSQKSLRTGALNISSEEITHKKNRSAKETLALINKYRLNYPHKKGVLRSEKLQSFCGERVEFAKKKSLRSSVNHIDHSSLIKYCTEHEHTPFEEEKQVKDHIIELQLLEEWNKEAKIPKEKLKKLANSPENLQTLGSLQNRAKAWVFLKVRQGYTSPQTKCPCFECVCTSLLEREHLRCAGSLRTLAYQEDFTCFTKSIQRAWNRLSVKLDKNSLSIFSDKMEPLLNCQTLVKAY